MFIDARSLEDGKVIDADLCIIGAGAAGITLARKFVGRGIKVSLLEGGGLEADHQSQNLYGGDIVGLPYHDLDVCRLRYFGGTTNHWAGYCWPFKPVTFQQRAWVPHSGWPIGQQDLAAYYDSAAQLLDLPLDGWDAKAGWDLSLWAERLGQDPIPFDPNFYEQRVAFINPLRLGQVYRAELERAADIHVFLNANVVEIETREAASQVSGVRVKTFDDKELTFKAKVTILAAGGIENPRLLLASNGTQKAGLGNQNDLVGRFFMDHVMVPVGFIQLDDPAPPIGLYNRRKRREELGGRRFVLGLDSTERNEKEQQLIPVGLYLEPILEEFWKAEGVRSLQKVYAALRDGGTPDDLGDHIANVVSDLGAVAAFSYARARYDEKTFSRVDVLAGLAPAPNRDSRVMLGEQLDALGVPRVKLDWRLSEIDYRSALWMAENFGADAAGAGLGRFKLTLGDETNWTEAMRGTRHHIGTTRMAEGALEGVVDRNCKVFGMANLFVAGSSVFPTCGKGSPTLAIIALAERLADHVMERFS